MIIDTHLHFFHDKIAATTLNQLKKFAEIEPTTAANRISSENYMQANGIDKVFALNIATKAKNNLRINDFAMQNNDEKIISFGSINPYLENYEEEIYRLKANGIKGIKFHPQYQEFDLGDKKFYPIYKAAEKSKLLMYFHMGYDPYSPNSDYANPEKLSKIADIVDPELIIAAHFGGYLMWDRVAECLSSSGIYMDTSVAMAENLNMDIFKKILSDIGTTHLLFATDTPWGKFSDTVAFVENLGLSDSEKELVFYKNALRLLKD